MAVVGRREGVGGARQVSRISRARARKRFSGRTIREMAVEKSRSERSGNTAEFIVETHEESFSVKVELL